MKKMVVHKVSLELTIDKIKRIELPAEAKVLACGWHRRSKMNTRFPRGYRNVVRWLNRRGACSEGMAWVKENKFESLADLWDNCHRSDWMLWLLDRVGYENDRDLRLFACACVRAIWDKLTDERSRRAVEVAEKYAFGDATDEELVAAWDAAGDAARAAAWDAQANMLRDKIGNPFKMPD